jgi:DNA-binding NtrC family response regulator
MAGMAGPARILVVDDEVALVEALSRQLGRLGYRPEGAFLVAEALRAIETSIEGGTPFDAVVTDLFLPDGEGTEIVRFVREKLPGTPVVVMTGSHSVSGSVTAMRLGAVTVLEKPLPIAALDAELRRAIEERARTAPAPRPDGMNLYAVLDELEDRLLREAVEKANGNHSEAARSLGLNRTTLLAKLRRLGKR